MVEICEEEEAKLEQFTQKRFATSELTGHLDRVKKMISDDLRGRPSLTQLARSQMMANVRGVRLITAEDLLNQSKGSVRDQQAISYLNVCGYSLQNLNAFYKPIFDENKVMQSEIVVVCPAFKKFVASLGYGSEAVIAVLAHEVGHSIDSSLHTIFGQSTTADFAPFYETVHQCADENYASSFRDGHSDEYMHEVSADLWGTFVLSQMLADIVDPIKQIQFIRSNLKLFCSLQEGATDGLHPPRSYRVTQATQFPGIRELLERANHWKVESRRACSL